MKEWLHKLWSTRVRRDHLIVSLLGLCWFAASIVLHEVKPDNFLRRLELTTTDMRFQWRGVQEPSPDVVIVGVDQESFTADTFDEKDLEANPDLRLMGTWPWPRRVHGMALDKLLAAGAKVVAFDLLFSTPSKYGAEDDASLRAALERNRGRVVIGANRARELVGDYVTTKWMMPTPGVVPETVPQLEVSGAVNYVADIDHVVRRLFPRWPFSEETQTVTALSVRAATLADPGAVWALDQREMVINYPGPEKTFPTFKFYQLFYGKSWNEMLRKGAAFKDKIVLIGPTQNFMQDSHATPFGPAIPGVEIHAASISTLLLHNELRLAPRGTRQVLMFCFTLLAVASILLVRHPLLKLLPPLGIAALYVAIAQIAFVHARLIVPLAAPLAILIPVTFSGLAWQLLTEQLEKRRARQALERQVSKEVADELMKEFGALEQMLAPQERPLVVFFSDIRNFTTLFEKGDAKTLITQLNEYLTAMSAIVAKHGGTLDKYIGDAIMAFWGAPTSCGPAGDALRAVSAALEMRAELAALQPQWKEKGWPEIKIGVGIHAGPALVGEVGSAQRSEYTAIGDAVNTASRIEGINKETGTDLLISQAVYNLVKERVKAQSVGEYALKGRAEKVSLYRVDGLGV
jgi:adenylate cyclase